MKMYVCMRHEVSYKKVVQNLGDQFDISPNLSTLDKFKEAMGDESPDLIVVDQKLDFYANVLNLRNVIPIVTYEGTYNTLKHRINDALEEIKQREEDQLSAGGDQDESGGKQEIENPDQADSAAEEEKGSKKESVEQNQANQLLQETKKVIEESKGGSSFFKRLLGRDKDHQADTKSESKPEAPEAAKESEKETKATGLSVNLPFFKSLNKKTEQKPPTHAGSKNKNTTVQEEIAAAAEEPVAERPAADPVAEEPPAEPEVQEPAAAAEEPVIERPAVDPVAEEPPAEPEVQEPAAAAEEPVIERPAADPVAEEPPAEPEVQEPAAAAEEPVIERPAADRVADQPDNQSVVGKYSGGSKVVVSIIDTPAPKQPLIIMDGAIQPKRLQGDASVVAVTAAAGGVGKTELSILLAHHLSENYRVALLDFNMQNPDVGQRTGIGFPFQKTLYDVLLLYRNRMLSAQAAEEKMISHYGMSVLVGIPDPSVIPHVTDDFLLSLLETLKPAFDVIIIDMDKYLSPVGGMPVITKCDRVVIPITSSISVLGHTTLLVSLLKQQKLNDKQLAFILNKSDEGGEVNERKIQDMFGKRMVAQLPYSKKHLTTQPTGLKNSPYVLEVCQAIEQTILEEATPKEKKRLFSFLRK